MAIDEQMLRDDAQARNEALDHQCSYIVQAPAGSGKTELLIQRYLKLLSVVDDPEEILAITFTRKAAAEMHLRVLDALRRRDRGETPKEEHDRLTFELAGLALQRSSECDWNLIGNPRRMRILTLDALNASVARAQPLSAPGCANGARIVIDAELRTLHRHAAVATLDWLAEDGDMQIATRNVLQHVDNNTGLYVSYVAQMLLTRDQWLPFVGSGLVSSDESLALRNRFEESLRFIVQDHLGRAEKVFNDVRFAEFVLMLDFAGNNVSASAGAANPISMLAGCTALPDDRVESMPQWLGIAELLLTQQCALRKRVDKRQGFPPENKERKQRITSLLRDMSENSELVDLLQGIRVLPPVCYSDEQWDVLLALFRLLPLAVIELKRLFVEQGVADHIEIALNAGAALGSAENPGDVALLLDYQLKHLLVDEMQDTSSAQYRMIEALTGGWEPGDGRSLYCVGDPMQSIYRFRSAEVGQFLLAREHGIGQMALKSLLLRRNFRSGENLVAWFNDVFPAVLADANDPSRGAVTYSEAVSATHLQGLGQCDIHPVFGSDPGLEASTGCSVIGATLAAHPDEDMVVLVRGRTHLPRLLAELRSAGIPYRAIEIDRLTDLPEIIDVLSLTRAAVHQGDRIAWLGLLRSPWIGLRWADLRTLVNDDTKSTVWELLQNQQRLDCMSAEGREAILRSRDILRDLVGTRRSQSLRDLVERCWFALGGPSTVADEYCIENIYRYFDVLGRLERNGTLLDVAELETTLDLEKVSSNENARLQIMTMHRAKGLQFDHVLLYGLGRAPGSSDRRVLSWFDVPEEHGVNRKIISPVAPRADLDHDPVHRYIELADAQKNKHEQARLLYVACTRAKKSLHLMGNVSVATNGESFKLPRSDSLLRLLWPKVESAFAKAFESHVLAPVADEGDIWAAPVLKRFSSPWKLPDVALLNGTKFIDDADELEEEVEFYWVGSEARVAGTLVHRWLQILADNREGSAQPIRPITRRWLREIGIGEDTGSAIARRVEVAIDNVIDDPKGQWILDGTGHAELALSGIYEGKLAAVILDRVRIDEDGTHWIIDYKTSSHEGGNLEGFLHVESVRYQPQLARYASLYSAWSGKDVKCALYFPLLRSFVEVKV